MEANYTYNIKVDVWSKSDNPNVKSDLEVHAKIMDFFPKSDMKSDAHGIHAIAESCTMQRELFVKKENPTSRPYTTLLGE